MTRDGLRPLRKARRMDVVRSTEARRLAPGVAELLLRNARVMSEGAIREGIGGHETYFGSTMLTIDLAEAAAELRAPVDEALAATLAPLLERSAHLRVTALRIARREAEARIAGYQSERLTAETRVRAAGTHIEVDVDVELSLVAVEPRRRRVL
jgi:hypothetical protein